ncbi:MAG: ATP-binding cassette domain-containing protein [Prevotellaceae bacterium]|nr:ATP-binding cassette domain-containing protein [Prevotellaceae bacterium]
MTDFILRAENVVKQFAHHRALNGVSINVPRGSIFGLLGPNGAGKTTLIRIINQITAPDSGAIYLNDKKLHANDVYNIGYLPEERGLYKKMKVGEQALYLAQLKGLSHAEATKRLKYWFERLNIMPWWNKKVEELSKGMAQKVQFAVTVLHEPELLIFDEPFSGFDPLNADMLKNEILALRDKGSTIIFSTHNMASVEELCSSLALINQGNCVLHGTLDEVRSSHSEHFYELCFSGNSEQLTKSIMPEFSVENIKKEGDIQVATLKMQGNEDANFLLNKILPLVKVERFAELKPTMHDIFIEAVRKTNK